MLESIRDTNASNPVAIRVSNLSKTYRVWHTPLERIKSAVAEAALRGCGEHVGEDHRITQQLARRALKGYREVQALRRISLEIGRGEIVGIIGYNGSGKSTLLQILAGTLTPSEGSVEVHGRLAALLELGSGINYEFTGRENAVLYGSILGFPRALMEQRMHAIEEFAEIGEFMDEPVKTYSTGMVARLAFSVLTQLDPDILIVDETLSVGDAYFQHKSMNLIRRFQAAGKTMLVVSHDPAAIKTMCTRAVILERGVVVTEGEAATVCDYYNALVAKKKQDHEIIQLEREKGRVTTRSGDRRVSIGDVELSNAQGMPARAFTVGEHARATCALEFSAAISDPTVGILIRDRLGNSVYGTNTFHQRNQLGHFAAGERCEVQFSFQLNLAPGRYSISLAVHSGRDHLSDNYDWQDNVIVFDLLPGQESTFVGVAWLPLKTVINRDGTMTRRNYAWGEQLSFAAEGNAERHKQSGWGVPEQQFTWTEGPEATLRFELEASEVDRVFSLRAAAFCTANLPAQRVEVLLDQTILGAWVIDAVVATYEIAVPAACLATHGRRRIRLALPDATSPKNEGVSNDARLLGLRVFCAQIK